MTDLQAKFTHGSIIRHVINMTFTGSIGLIAIFVVDFLNLIYIARLGQQELAAAVGYAGTLFFFFISIGIGLSIATTAVVARALGARLTDDARRLSGSSLLITLVVAVLLYLAVVPFTRPFLALVGAEGVTLEIADRFLHQTLPGMVLMFMGMTYSSVLRAAGDGTRAMWVTLSGGLVTAVADPVFIFGFGLGLDGAAIATNIARFAMLATGYYGCVKAHDLVAKPSLADVRQDARAIAAIAVPAILTNVATPVSNALVTGLIARHGDAAVAGYTVIGRIWPMAFAGFFALSGAVGPIMSQNLGAKQYDRVRQTLTDSLRFVAIYGLIVWVLLMATNGLILKVFDAHGAAAQLITVFSFVIALGWAFNGAQFTANAAFNNLGFPTYSTLFNWGRATLGTLPFAWLGHVLGGEAYGAEGVLAGHTLGGVVFGVASAITCYHLLNRMGRATT